MPKAGKSPKKKSPKKTSTKPTTKPQTTTGLKTLAFDIGGTGLKATVLDERGKMLTDKVRIETPQPCPPKVLLEKLKELLAQLPEFDRVSVGFPGVVRHGKTLSCKNLGSDEWSGYNLQSAIAKVTGKPTLVINDADMQGLGAAKGKGVELVITLGTGLGSALFEDGRLAPHIELAHIPFRKGQTYEQQLGNKAFKKISRKEWHDRLILAIEYFRILTNFDKLYLGGGNAKEIQIDLGDDVVIVNNKLGMLGGIWLWKDSDLSDGVQK